MLDLDSYAGLRTYFQSMYAIDPQDLRWNAALTSLETWHEFSQTSPINQTALIALIQTINIYKHQSSGWFALALLINTWINNQAINAPTIFEWNPRT
ncbi:hypothetical protein [Herpetosiphon giganteus]|uniref:hypothetical protein n=1 Tax=Herpetosiphon giganteus TaxID=2029754 RepID=UPI00195BDB4D|nr:hypothetical protein [Herpetosiphon giganteus]MBM7844601.1 hypothetical protein [Herpetosiphon giganteus]